MANKTEKKIIWEIQQAQSKILPLTGLSGGPTVTLIEIGKSWMAHQPLHDKIGSMIYHFNNYVHYTEKEDKDYCLEKINDAIEEFWKLNEENFGELSSERQRYED